MYHPTSRVLTVLELLQSRPFISGPELAARLEMDVRTVRRYITHLQDVGIPVEANTGRYGGYRLRPGFKLPPLMLTEEEATAIMLGLLGTSWLEIGQSSVAVEGALAKVSRVLPLRARERLNAMASHLFFFSHQREARPNVSLVINLSEAIGQQQRIAMNYRSHLDQLTHRKVEPYGMVGWNGHWYLVGYCCLRQDYRTFRLDRVQQVELADAIFVGHKGDGLSVIAKIKIRHVPLDVGGQVRGLHGGQVKIGQPMKFRVAVRGSVNSFAIFAETCIAVSNLFCAALWRKQLLFSRSHVHQP